MGKTLVAYFSASGVTARAAKNIANEIGADLYEMRPVEPYTSADLDWTNRKSRSSVEMNAPDFRPAIAEPVEDMAQYDTILVGFPIWWYVEPRIVDTFLERYDFSGKNDDSFCHFRWQWDRTRGTKFASALSVCRMAARQAGKSCKCCSLGEIVIRY